ncbi:hypothetical protein KC19_8G016100 [Ceratodon purpureus]|uniref:Amino acid transporter n=1 Tax=Ceratodon purpureus TaxID=3225 RepID=A0A8T0GWH6_CERPU|nr:hypothetical protein KC19_8G016100 [Ceratodon purpureus]
MADQSVEQESLIANQTYKRTSDGEDEELGTSNSELGLRRSLSLVDGISMLVGIIVGSGVFTSPGVVLQDAGSVGLGLTAWIAASFMALCSALVYAELGAAIPQAGGNAEYFRIAFGEAWGFAFIWTMFFVLTNGSVAIVAITFSRYIVAGFTGVSPLESDVDSDPVVKAVAIGCVAVLTIWNCFGVHLSAKLQNVLSAMKLLLVSILVVAAISFVWDDSHVLKKNMHKPFKGSDFSGFGVSCVAAMWAFSGWGDLVFLTEELKDPARNIPRGTISSMAIVMVIYLLLNVTYLCILPASVVKTSAVVAIDATNAALGPWAGSLMSILVSLSALGAANGIIICGARYLYAAARQGQIFKSIGLVGVRSRAPYVAHLLQGTLCTLLLLQSSNFVELISFLGVSSYLFYGLSAAAHIKLRHDLPDLHRPYTLGFYPYAPLIVICFSLYLVVSALIAQPLPTSLSLGFVVSSFPVYYLFIR